MSVFGRKRKRSAEFRFEVEDSEAARRRLDQARRTAQIVRLGESDEAKADAERTLEDAQAAYDACFEVVRFEQNTAALEEIEQRVAERPDRDGEKGYRWWHDPESLPVELISACCVTVEWTPKEWVEELTSDRWTIQDRRALFEAAMQANARVAYDVGKG